MCGAADAVVMAPAIALAVSPAALQAGATNDDKALKAEAVGRQKPPFCNIVFEIPIKLKLFLKVEWPRNGFLKFDRFNRTS